MRQPQTLLLVAFSVLLLTSCTWENTYDTEPIPQQLDLEKATHAVIHTNFGDIKIMFYRELAPLTVRNFVELSDRGYYDGVIFHRIIEGFMMQGGDPTGTGSGGESIYGETFEDEIDLTDPIVLRGYKRGTVAMANAGPNTNGSQFFIMHKSYPLQRNYTIFGNVVEGIEVVDSICTTQKDATDRPLNKIYMDHITLLIED